MIKLNNYNKRFKIIILKLLIMIQKIKLLNQINLYKFKNILTLATKFKTVMSK